MRVPRNWPARIWRRAADAAPRRRDRLVALAGLAVVVVIAPFAYDGGTIAQALAWANAPLAFALAARAYGARGALVFLAAALGVSFTVENIGLATGFPFGRYVFTTEPGLPHIGAVPAIVGSLWFSMGFYSWMVARLLLVGPRLYLRRPAELAFAPLVAAMVMTQWDLALDAGGSTLAGAWVWRDGGAFFGVPVQNYFGWLLTSWLFYQPFALYLYARRDVGDETAASPTVWGLAALFYLSAGLTHLTPWLLSERGLATDGAGRVWRVEDLHGATATVMLLSMGVSAFLALARLRLESGRAPPPA